VCLCTLNYTGTCAPLRIHHCRGRYYEEFPWNLSIISLLPFLIAGTTFSTMNWRYFSLVTDTFLVTRVPTGRLIDLLCAATLSTKGQHPTFPSNVQIPLASYLGQAIAARNIIFRYMTFVCHRLLRWLFSCWGKLHSQSRFTNEEPFFINMYTIILEVMNFIRFQIFL
jgi:hypothetical protein